MCGKLSTIGGVLRSTGGFCFGFVCFMLLGVGGWFFFGVLMGDSLGVVFICEVFAVFCLGCWCFF